MTGRKRLKNIAELAQLAGVSTGTVSRALADSPLISEKTRLRIQALAREYDFRPNVLARNLRIQRAGAIGVVIPLGHEQNQPVSDPFFMALIGHLADRLTERGEDLLLSRVIPRRADWLDAIVDSGRVDGVILIGQSDQWDVIDAVAARYRPLVVWGAHRPGQRHCSVGTDNRLGGLLAAQHLIERGSRRIAFLGDPLAPEIGDRFDGCRAALAEAGLAEAMLHQSVHLTAELAYPAIAAWLDSLPVPPDGIVAASDVIAMCALRALAERGLSVPGDVRVIGYDDLPFASQTNPPLSSIRQDIAGGADHLVRLLFRRIAGEDSAGVEMAPTVVVRQSS